MHKIPLVRSCAREPWSARELRTAQGKYVRVLGDTASRMSPLDMTTASATAADTATNIATAADTATNIATAPDANKY